MASGDDDGDDTADTADAAGAADDDAWRWVRAEERAAGVVVPDEWPVLRRFLLVEVPVALAGCVGIGAVVASIWGEWQSWIGISIVAAGFIAIVAGYVHVLKRDPVPPHGGLALVLTHEIRKDNARQVMGRRLVDPEHLNVLRLAARYVRREAMRIMYTLIGVELMIVGSVLLNIHRGGWGLAFFVVMSVALPVLLLLPVHVTRRATAFLRHYPEQTPESASP